MSLQWLWLLFPIVLVLLVVVGERRRGSGPSIEVKRHSWTDGSGGIPGG